MKIRELNRQGMGIRAIARTLGISRQVVRKTLQQTVPERYRKRPPRPRKLDPFVDDLERLARERPHIRATRLYEEIVAKGYTGHYEAVKVWTRTFRRAEQARRSACVRLETDPGEEGQFDWKGPALGLIPSNPEQKIWFFRLVYGYSRRRFTFVVARTTLPMVLENLRTTFEQAGGTPARLVFDNFNAAVIHPRPHLELNPPFVEFCRHYGTSPAPALPYNPERKGKVERSFRDLIDAGVLDRTWESIADLQSFVTIEDERHGGRICSSTGQTPAERFERERGFLIELPAVAFDVRLAEPRRVLRDCTVSYRGAYYSVPARLAGARVIVKAAPAGDVIEIVHLDESVAVHPVIPKGQRRVLEEHVAVLRRPRWDRLRKPKPEPVSPPPPVPALVVWPRVTVENRPIEDYAALVDGGGR